MESPPNSIGQEHIPAERSAAGSHPFPDDFFRDLAEQSPDLLLVLSTSGAVSYASPSMDSIIGHPPGEFIGCTMYEIVHAQDHPELTQILECSGSTPGQDSSYRLRVQHAGGEWRVLDVRFRRLGNDAGVAQVLLDCRDVTERTRMEEELRDAALYDPLTGLPNRTLFMERLEHAAARTRRRGHVFAVLFMDLDRFKVINDSLGHVAGDNLLRAVADRLRSCVRPMDTVARFGGDEFALLLEEIPSLATATRITERILHALSSPVDVGGYEVYTSASIGIAAQATSSDSPEYLLRSADTAMYRAKASGHAQYAIFDRAMHAEALQRLQLETDLRRALDRGEMQLFYQPIISLESGQIQAFEALIRWAHPERGFISPMEFIPSAEETGLILPIGAWALREACKTLRKWQDQSAHAAELSVAVNLSAKQLAQPGLVELVQRTLEETGLEARHLKLEVTESGIIENSAMAIATLKQLKAIGVGTHMDDFGTGYSSLSHLHILPLDALKIDRSFVSRMETDLRAQQLVRTILALADSMGLSVIAEGVESSEQLNALRTHGCDSVQGYLFSPPVNERAAEELLEQSPIW